MHKISYQKLWSEDGTCFTQCITISQSEYEIALGVRSENLASMQAKYAREHIISCSDMDTLLYLGASERKSYDEHNNLIVFTNLTQSYNFIRALGINKEPRCLFCRNTCFKVVKEKK